MSNKKTTINETKAETDKNITSAIISSFVIIVSSQTCFKYFFIYSIGRDII